MAFFFRLRAVLGWRGGAGRIALELKRRGATRELVRFLEPFETNALGAWKACPRGAWCLEMAARIGIETGVLYRATAKLFEGSPLDAKAPGADPREWLDAPAQDKKGASSAVLIAAQRSLQRLQRAHDVDAFVVAVESLCFELVDGRPEVRKARHEVEEAQRWGRFREVLEASERYDEAYAAGHAELADEVRRHVPAPLIQRALGEFAAHPYR